MLKTLQVSESAITYDGMEYHNVGLRKYPVATYAAAHDADNADALSLAGELGNIIICQSSFAAGAGYSVSRGYISFQTSRLGAFSRIYSVSLEFRCSSKSEIDSGHSTLHIVQGIHTETITLADFGLLKPKIVSGGSKSYDNIVVGENVIGLNAIGALQWISKTGMTRLGLRLAGDIDNDTPSGQNYLLCHTPTLRITYIPIVGNPTIDQIAYQHAERMEK